MGLTRKPSWAMALNRITFSIGLMMAAMGLLRAEKASACFGAAPSVVSECSGGFVFDWQPGWDGRIATVPAGGFDIPEGTVFDFEVDWGDGTEPTRANSEQSPPPVSFEHLYARSGSYTVTIKGQLEALEFSPRCIVTQVFDLGDLGWKSLKDMFAYCSDLTTVWGGNVSGVTDMSGMFRGAPKANPETGAWDVSNVTDMSRMFMGALQAAPATEHWDVSSVTDMSRMFLGTRNAAPNTKRWDVSSVTDMSRMFMGTRNAVPNTKRWDVSSVTDMSAMFRSARVAKPDTLRWDVSGVTDMSGMFMDAEKANPATRRWDVSSVVYMSSMFEGAVRARPNTDHWDVSGVQRMSRMFLNAPRANSAAVQSLYARRGCGGDEPAHP